MAGIEEGPIEEVKTKLGSFLEHQARLASNTSHFEIAGTPRVFNEIISLLHQNPGVLRKRALETIRGALRHFLQTGTTKSISSFDILWEKILTRIAEGADLSPLLHTKTEPGPIEGQPAKVIAETKDETREALTQ